MVLDNLRLVGWRSLIVLRELVATRSFVRLAGDANSVTPTATLGGELVRVRLLHDKSSAVDHSRSQRIRKNRNREGMSSPAFFRATNGFPKLVGLLLPFLWPRLPSTSSKKLSLLN